MFAAPPFLKRMMPTALSPGYGIFNPLITDSLFYALMRLPRKISLEKEVSLGYYPGNIALNHRLGHIAVDVAVEGQVGQIHIYDFELNHIETIDDVPKDVALSYSKSGKNLISAAGGICHLYDANDDYEQTKEWDVGKPDATALALLGQDAFTVAACEEIAIIDLTTKLANQSLNTIAPSAPLYGIGIFKNYIAFGARPTRKAHVNDYAPLQMVFEQDKYRFVGIEEDSIADITFKRVNPEHGDLQVLWENGNFMGQAARFLRRFWYRNSNNRHRQI